MIDTDARSEEPSLRAAPLPEASIVESIWLRAAGSGAVVAVAWLAELQTRTRVAITAFCAADLLFSLAWRRLWRRRSHFPIVFVSAGEGIAVATGFVYLEPRWNVIALFAYVMAVCYLGAFAGRAPASAVGASTIVLAIVREVTLADEHRLGAFPLVLFALTIVVCLVYTNAQSFARVRTAQSLERLHEALRTVTSQPDLHATLDSITAAARQAVRAEDVVIQLRDGDHVVMAAGGYEDPRWSADRIERLTRWELASGDKTPLARAINHGETVIVPDVTSDPRFPEWTRGFTGLVGTARARALVMVPLDANDETVGAISAFFGNRDLLDAETVRLLQTYAEHVALMIVRAQAYDRQRQLSARLREADRLKSEFVALASHQLRTPLTATKGFIDTVLVQWDRLDDPARRRMLERAAGTADELGRMLAQLLDLSRIESDDVHLDVRPTPLADAVASVVAALSPLSRHEVVIDVVADLVAFVDRDAFAHVLDNLVANALKFSPPQTRVVVRAMRDGDEIVVEVADEGPGIALEEQERVFERFYQSPTARNTEGGTGLGLSIAQSYVEALGGRIWVESEPGEGTTMVFSVPAVPRDGSTPVDEVDHAIR